MSESVERETATDVFMALLQENVDSVEWTSREHEERGTRAIRERWILRWEAARDREAGPTFPRWRSGKAIGSSIWIKELRAEVERARAIEKAARKAYAAWLTGGAHGEMRALREVLGEQREARRT